MTGQACGQSSYIVDVARFYERNETAPKSKQKNPKKHHHPNGEEHDGGNKGQT